ncbi:hypothetical protein Tco_1525268 [Tanacetum coccineum]
MSTKRRPKRKTRIPIKYNDTVCDLTQSKGGVGSSKDDDGSEKRMDNGRIDDGGSGSKVDGKEFNVTEFDFPLLSEINSMNRKGCSNMSLGEEGTKEKEYEKADNCDEVRHENEENYEMDRNINQKDGMNSDLNMHNISQNGTIANENDYCKTPTSKTFANIVRPVVDNGDNKLCQIPITVEDGREVVIFDEELIIEGSRKWSLTLCGHFVGFKMSYSEIQSG